MRRGRSGHSPSTSPRICTSSRSAKRAACASRMRRPPASGRGREGLRAEPAPNRGRQLGDRAGRRRIVPPIGGGQAVERDATTAARTRAAALVVIAIVAHRETRAAAQPDRRSAAIRAAARASSRRRARPGRPGVRRRSMFRRARAGDRVRRDSAAPPSPTSSAAIDARSTSAPSTSNRKCGDRSSAISGAAREVRGRAFEHHIDGGGVRFGGQRQRVERFERNARAGKHFAREIEIRQRPRHDQADAVERDVRRGDVGLDPPRDAFEFVFAIAITERESSPGTTSTGAVVRRRVVRRRLVRRSRRTPAAVDRDNRRRARRRSPGFDLFEAGDRREHRDVGGPEAVGIERAIADRDDQLPQRPRRRRGDECARAPNARQPRCRRRGAPRRRETRRREIASARAAAAAPRSDSAAGSSSPLSSRSKSSTRAAEATEVIVEREHLGDQRRAARETARGAPDSSASRAPAASIASRSNARQDARTATGSRAISSSYRSARDPIPPSPRLRWASRRSEPSRSSSVRVSCSAAARVGTSTNVSAA